jgi:DNA-binding transcriptional MerR regulator
MKMAQLSRETGVPVATIKYYLREGLLASGERTEPNQASYDDSHVRRLRIIRALVDVGGLSGAAAKRVVEAIDSDRSTAEAFEVAQHTVSARVDEDDSDAASVARIGALLDGWNYRDDNPGLAAAARVLTTFEAVGQRDDRGWFRRYADAALVAAEADLDEVETRDGRDAQVETVVVGTVLGDVLFAALRRVAQEHVTSVRYPHDPGATPHVATPPATS